MHNDKNSKYPLKPLRKTKIHLVCVMYLVASIPVENMHNDKNTLGGNNYSYPYTKS